MPSHGSFTAVAILFQTVKIATSLHTSTHQSANTPGRCVMGWGRWCTNGARLCDKGGGRWCTNGARLCDKGGGRWCDRVTLVWRT